MERNLSEIIHTSTNNLIDRTSYHHGVRDNLIKMVPSAYNVNHDQKSNNERNNKILMKELIN